MDFSNRDLSRMNLSFSDFTEAKFNATNLTKADLGRSVFYRADLIEANLEGAELQAADFRQAYLMKANLKGIYLGGVDFTQAALTQADLSGSTLNSTVFGENYLDEVIGLDSVIHNAPSVIGIATIYRSKGNIPEIFLRGCGVPENFITYMHSLTGQALEFYKCFISFTEADDVFSERLYNDLQGAGVRCWRWKEDAKWGKTLMRSIDEAVRLYDKVVVICSEQSLNAPAVIREIERALQKEDELARQGKEAEVLFPIRLDDYIFNGWNHHRKADVIAKNVGDFKNWNEPEKYKKAFERLLRDLKASE
ncbi:MAG: hypothetical protein DMF68_01880 [Acidobacteria bacterium]|nr:MAG: hypothetical protein DMF68_01880 [Acidobacteriota bacterium]